MAELGSSPVADYSKIGQIGLHFQQRAQQRSADEFKNVQIAFEQSNEQLQSAKQQMMMLPEGVAAQFSEEIEKVLESRATAILGGSSVSTSQSTQEFQNIAMAAAKIGAVNKDLVSKYEKVRQSAEYAKNKEAYDLWYETANETISVQAAQGLDGAAQLDFFQPPILQPDIDIIEHGTALFQNAHNPAQYRVPYNNAGGSGVKFNEEGAKSDAVSFIQKQYDLGGSEMAQDIDYQSVQRLHGEAKPDSILELISSYKDIEDELTTRGLKSSSDVDALEGVSASDKRRLKSGLEFINSRQGVMDDTAAGFVSSIRIADSHTPATTSKGGGVADDFGWSATTYENILSAATITKENLTPGAPIGFVSTKGAATDSYGKGENMRYYDGMTFDGESYMIRGYRPSAEWLASAASRTIDAEGIKDALFEGNFTEMLIPLSRVSGDIPNAELQTMINLAEQNYQMALKRAPAAAAPVAPVAPVANAEPTPGDDASISAAEAVSGFMQGRQRFSTNQANQTGFGPRRR